MEVSTTGGRAVHGMRQMSIRVVSETLGPKHAVTGPAWCRHCAKPPSISRRPLRQLRRKHGLRPIRFIYLHCISLLRLFSRL
ncbi:hypothetical protein HYQ46_012655 [Verticillium longisporum]|nr:hypothetical protein HYQ46_012655 [Verticillium longisporum]